MSHHQVPGRKQTGSPWLLSARNVSPGYWGGGGARGEKRGAQDSGEPGQTSVTNLENIYDRMQNEVNTHPYAQHRAGTVLWRLIQRFLCFVWFPFGGARDQPQALTPGSASTSESHPWHLENSLSSGVRGEVFPVGATKDHSWQGSRGPYMVLGIKLGISCMEGKRPPCWTVFPAPALENSFVGLYLGHI